MIAIIAGVETFAPHEGPTVMFVSTNKFMFIVAIIVESLETALIANFLKKDYVPEGDLE